MNQEMLREKLRMHRMKSGASMVQLAEVIGVATQQTYYKKEAGLLRFSIKEALALAKFFGVSVEELFGE